MMKYFIAVFQHVLYKQENINAGVSHVHRDDAIARSTQL
jgi:hypothetical protein